MIQICKTTTAELSDYLMSNPGCFYIGRGYGSKLGNPFSRFSDGEDVTALAVQAYRAYLSRVLRGVSPKESAQNMCHKYNVEMSAAWEAPTTKELVDALNVLYAIYKSTGHIKLVCYCCDSVWSGAYANKCHGEALAAFLVWKTNASNNDTQSN